MTFKYPVQNPGIFEVFSAGLIMDSENDLPTNEPGMKQHSPHVLYVYSGWHKSRRSHHGCPLLKVSGTHVGYRPLPNFGQVQMSPNWLFKKYKTGTTGIIDHI